MTTYSQYDTTSSVVSTHYTFTCSGIQSDAVRYSHSAGKNIAFETSANAPGAVHVWRDDGVDYPLKFSHSSSGPWTDSVADAATIYMSADAAGTSGVGSFSSPQWQYSSANPANSGTSTEGSTAPSGSTYINSQGQIVFVINGSSPSSDGTIVYKIFRRPIGSAFEQAYVVPHTNGSDTEWTIGLNYSLYDRWELRVESTTALVQSGVLARYSTGTSKVFTNFW